MFDKHNYSTLEFQTKTEAEKPPFVLVSDWDYSTKTMLWICTFLDCFFETSGLPVVNADRIGFGFPIFLAETVHAFGRRVVIPAEPTVCNIAAELAP